MGLEGFNVWQQNVLTMSNICDVDLMLFNSVQLLFRSLIPSFGFVSFAACFISFETRTRVCVCVSALTPIRWLFGFVFYFSLVRLYPIGIM